MKTILPRYQLASLPPVLSCHICIDIGVPRSSGHFIRKEPTSPRPKFCIEPNNSRGKLQKKTSRLIALSICHVFQLISCNWEDNTVYCWMYVQTKKSIGIFCIHFFRRRYSGKNCLFSKSIRYRQNVRRMAWIHPYLSHSVIHHAYSSFTLSAVHSEEDFGLGSCRHFEASVDVDQVLVLIFIVVVDKWQNGPLNTNINAILLVSIIIVMNLFQNCFSCDDLVSYSSQHPIQNLSKPTCTSFLS